MKRHSDWEKRLDSFCRARRSVPFAWGVNDCALFVADAIESFTGIDLAHECRGRYDSKESAAALLNELCGGDLEKYADRMGFEHGLLEVGLKLARRGDMVLLWQPAGCSLGIVSLDGMNALLMHEERGLIRVPVAACRRAWRVG